MDLRLKLLPLRVGDSSFHSLTELSLWCQEEMCWVEICQVKTALFSSKSFKKGGHSRTCSDECVHEQNCWQQIMSLLKRWTNWKIVKPWEEVWWFVRQWHYDSQTETIGHGSWSKDKSVHMSACQSWKKRGDMHAANMEKDNLYKSWPKRIG